MYPPKKSCLWTYNCFALITYYTKLYLSKKSCSWLLRCCYYRISCVHLSLDFRACWIVYSIVYFSYNICIELLVNSKCRGLHEGAAIFPWQKHNTRPLSLFVPKAQYKPSETSLSRTRTKVNFLLKYNNSTQKYAVLSLRWNF